MDVSNKESKYYSVTFPFRQFNDTIAACNWCEKIFGSGGYNRVISEYNQCQWALLTFDNGILFKFRTQQQLDWFTLKWL